MADGNAPNEIQKSAADVELDFQQIAEALAQTKRAVQMRSQKENWAFTETPVRGGRRRLYNLASLPGDVQAAVVRHQAIQAASKTEASAEFKAGQSIARRSIIAESIESQIQHRVATVGATNAAALTGIKKQRMEARLDILARLDAYAEKMRIGKCNAMQDFCNAYGAGNVQVPVAVRHFVGPDLCPMTLRRWRKALKLKGAAALGGSYGNRSGSSIIETNAAMRDFVIGLMADKPHISAKLVSSSIAVRFKDLPSPRSVARFMAKWKAENAEAFSAITSPDAWKNKYKIALGSLDEGVERANQLWQVDSTPGDIQLIDGRYNILGCIDIATRRVKLHVEKTSTAQAVTKLIRKSILAWGYPETIKMDNGRDYASDRVQYTLTALHIQARFSAPFSPWEKGNIERFFRTFSHSLLELLPGFAGHNVAEAQTLRASKSFAERMFKKNAVTELKISAAELQSFCDQWTDNVYAHEAHGGLNGKTPFARAAELRHHVRTVSDVRALDMLLADVPDNNGIRTVSKKGIKVGTYWFIAPELAMVVGQPVMCRYLDDIGQITVYHNEAFLCVAECPDIVGVSRLEVAAQAKKIQNENVSEQRRELKRLARKADTNQVVQDILASKAEQAAKLSAFPAPNVVHITPALEAAADAAAYINAAPREQIRETTIADLDGVRDLRASELAKDETSKQRFKRTADLLMTPANERNDLDRRFLSNYTSSAEFLGSWEMFESFGPGAVGLDDTYLELMPDGAFYNRYTQLKHLGEN